MEDGKLGVAIHGVGQVARAHAASWINNPHTEIVSISSRRTESAQKLVDELGLECAVRDNYDEVLTSENRFVIRSQIDHCAAPGPGYLSEHRGTPRHSQHPEEL